MIERHDYVPDIDLIGRYVCGYVLSGAEASRRQGSSRRFSQYCDLPKGDPVHDEVIPPEIEIPEEQRVTAAESLKSLQESSGLSWEQLAKLFGVGRRTVQLWAQGTRISQTNREMLQALIWLNRYFNFFAAPKYHGATLYDILHLWNSGHPDVSGEGWFRTTPSCEGKGHLVKALRCSDCP